MLPGMDKSDPSYKGQSGHNAAMLAIYDNVDETAEGLRRILETSFRAVDIDVVGSAALFAAARPI